MVATLLRLKLHLTIGELRRSTAKLVAWIILGVYVLGMVVMALVGMAAASFVVGGHEAATGWITIIVGSVIVLGWTLLPLVFFGSDQTLDPARFTPFPLTGRRLAPGLVLAGVLGLPGFFTALLSLGSALIWLGRPLIALIALVSGALGFLMTQVGCRVASTALSGTLSSRRARDLTALIGLVAVLLLSMLGYVITLIANFLSQPDRWDAVVAGSQKASWVLSWTPLGAPWAVPSDAAQGQWLMMAFHLVVTCAYLVLGLWLYAVVLDKALVTPVLSDSTSTVSKTDFVATVASGRWAHDGLIPVAAIMARSLRYWRRDPRYLGTIPALLLMPIIFTAMGPLLNSVGSTQSEPVPSFLITGMVAFGLGFMALLAGYGLSADVASDSTAWWIHLACGVRGWQDRLGRVLAEGVLAIPLLVVVGVVVPIIVGSPARIPAALAAMMALYLAGNGVSSVFSALIIYPMALPGESPLKMKTGMMGLQSLSQGGSMLATGLLSLPVTVWAIFARGWQGWAALGVGVVWGCVLAGAGVVLGGRIMDARGPAILASLQKNDTRQRA
ncbi:MAG: hypothetical protein FWD75_04235 [Propionibacteriaceae bacterium]|nr:hypothetical protein [Propionibacteriaceae bacterium]